jgi:hypothetical protein
VRPNLSCWLVGLAAMTAACSSGNGGSQATGSTATAQGEPIAECVAYEQAFARCNGVTAPVLDRARMASLAGQERERMQRLCAANLDRLDHACR